MGNFRFREDCRYFPICRHLEPLFLNSQRNQTDWGQIVFSSDFEPICGNCEDFEPKEPSPGG